VEGTLSEIASQILASLQQQAGREQHG